MRVARELHQPLAVVLEYPQSELDMWYLVFEREYYELNPEEKPTTISTAMNYLGEGTVRHRKKGEKAKLSGKIKE